MEFITLLKITAQQIIELSGKLGDRTHTWNQENNAPAGGYTDRAGFIVDEIELHADVYVADGSTDGLQRARMALVPVDEKGQEFFTIVTLHFATDISKAKTIIQNALDLTQQTLISLLHDPATKPSYIHVSLEAGKDAEGNSIGKRLEYSSQDLQELTEASQKEFLSTLHNAYEQIVSKV